MTHRHLWVFDLDDNGNHTGLVSCWCGKQEQDSLPVCGTGRDDDFQCEPCIAARPCDACGAEATEPCRPGCLGYAIEHGDLTEPCS